MSQYAAISRTNYFRITDRAAFEADLERHGLSVGTFDGYADLVLDNDHGRVALFGVEGWPSLDEDAVAARLGIEDEDTPLPTDYDIFADLIAAHLVDGEVAILVEIGKEKFRYLGGTAVAVNSAGEQKMIDLDDIYGLARELTSDSAAITPPYS